MRQIDADALKEAIINVIEAEESIDKKWATGLKYSLAIIDSAPTVEPEKVLVANVTFDEDKLKEIVNSEVIEKIRNKMFFVREEDSDQPIAVIKVADLMKRNGGEEK